MRHKAAKYQLNRFTSWRKATVAATTRNLLLRQGIVTTRSKAKAAVPLIEKLVSLAKDNSLHAKREAYKILCDHKLVSMLFSDIGPRFSKRESGFTRIIGLGYRRGDNARLVLLELTEIKKKEARKEAKSSKEAKPEIIKEERPEEKRPKLEPQVSEKPPITKKPPKKFLGGLRKIFKKERDSL